MTHLLSVDQFDALACSQLFELARSIETSPRGSYQIPSHTVLTNLFYEPSTRTSSSFYSAMRRLGGSVIPINDVNFSSVSKGETLEDTIQVIAQYSDAIVLRHPEKGSVHTAAKHSKVPVINGGDGIGEHPTQALLDLYTIYKHKTLDHRQKPLEVALVGDLKHGRTVHSLLKLLRMYNTKIHLVSPPGFEMPDELVQTTDVRHRDLWGCINQVDVIYMTRVQKERIQDPHLLSQMSNYAISLEQMNLAKPDMILMHPLPRVDELPRVLDKDPRSKYFEQTGNGLIVRQAIFYSLFGLPTVPWKKIDF